MISLVCALVLAGSPLTTTQVSPVPTPGADSRLQVLHYDAGRVFRLRVPMGFQTALILDPNERVENIALGDSESWQVTPNRRGDHVFIKPLRSGGATNLTLVTDVRVYVFDLSTASGSTGETPFTIRFTYPEAPANPPATETSPRTEPGRYRMSGNRSVQPESVSDDGEKTYIQWRPDQAMPAIFAIDDRRREILVDGQMREGRYVIDAVHRTLIFRLDRDAARAVRIAAGEAR